MEEQSGSTHKVPYTQILAISPHSNAERLELATVYGFQVIVQKGRYQVGDKVIYVPIDSLLPQWLEDILFPADSKIRLHHHRIRQIRIRGLASQGMLIPTKAIESKVNPKYIKDEQDLAASLGITKYEPPQAGPSWTQGQPKNKKKKSENPLFHKYNGLDNIKWFPTFFKDGEEVVVQEKLHGTNARASVLPYHAGTWWKKILKLLRLTPKFEKCYGSNNVDITSNSEYKGYYGEDLYGKTFDSIGVFNRLLLGEIVYGEIIGPGIQKNYTYGLKEHHFVLFDVKIIAPDGSVRWLTPEQVEEYAEQRGFEYVPVLYRGPFNKDFIFELTKGNSVYDTKQKVREGIVIKARQEYTNSGTKRALKWISESYLDDSDNTDFH